MAINPNVLSFIAGAAEKFTETKDELKKELRDNKRRQKDYLNTYGYKAIEENNQKQQTVQAALEDLQSKGLSIPDAIQLLQKHGVNSVLELQKYVKDYEEKNSTNVTSDLMNKIWRAADDYTSEETNFEDAVAKVFGTTKGQPIRAESAAPVIQEAENRNFFDIIKRNISGDIEDEEYEDFLSDPTEGIGGYTINEIRRMSAASPDMLGSAGAATFDRSILRSDEPTASETRAWTGVQQRLVIEMLKRVPEDKRDDIEMRENSAGDLVKRNPEDIFYDLEIDYKDIFDEVTREEKELLGNNRAAEIAYGGAARLNEILNPPPPPEPLSPEELTAKLEQDLIDKNLTGENRPEDLGESTDAQVGEYFRDNNEDFVISNNELIDRPASAPFDESKVVVPIKVTDYDENTFELKIQPTQKPDDIPEKPQVETTILGGMSSEDREKLSDWNEKYEGKINDNGTYKLVRPRPVKPDNFSELERSEKGQISRDIQKWDRLYKDTHDPETGYPDIENLDMTLIPIEASQQ